MQAVIVNGAVIYLGNDSIKAVEIFTSKKDDKASLVSVHTLSELASALEADRKASEPQTVEEGFSQAIERVFEMLDEAGINESSIEEVVATLKQRSDAAVAEVRHLGIKSMQTVGEGFVALGDLLKKAGQKEPDSDG